MLSDVVVIASLALLAATALCIVSHLRRRFRPVSNPRLLARRLGTGTKERFS